MYLLLPFLCPGNLHQSQYCDKLKSIVEFLGPKLSVDELTTMWEMQVDKNPVQVCGSRGMYVMIAWADLLF